MPRPTPERSHPRFIPSAVRQFFPFVVAVSIASAAFNSLSESSLHRWYAHLIKPDWAFTPQQLYPVSIGLYALLALGAWQLYRKLGWEAARSSLTLWGFQLVLLTFWPGFFFALRRREPAAMETAVLFSVSVVTMIVFWRKDRAAGVLMGIACGVMGYGTTLTELIWRLNR